MSFVDKVIHSAKNMANAASEKAGEVYEIGKLRLALASLNSDLDAAYTQLGRLEYDARRNKNDNTVLIEACLAEIDSIQQDMDSLTQEIAEATGERVCPHCAESVAADAAYCPKCGAKMEAKAAEAAPLEEDYITVESNEAPAQEE